MFRWTCSVLAAGVVVVLSTPAPSAASGEKPHPHIHIALYELRETRTELLEAKHDFGGHREKALKDVDAAIVQCEKALKYVDDKRPYKGDPKAEVYKKYAHHPHIHHALVELRAAVVELEEAKHDFGGHRKAAIVDCNAAIEQLHLCLKHAKGKG
jgi:hypothetical protein